MDWPVVIIVIVALVALSTLAGVVTTRRRGRRVAGPSAEGAIAPTDLAEGAGPVPVFGEAATLVQFSTGFCARCPGTRRMLGSLVASPEHAGVALVEVDLTERRDLASRFAVLSTPTVLVLDRDGAPRARFAGAPTSAAVRTALSEILERTTRS